jgi:hypothetical protein
MRKFLPVMTLCLAAANATCAFAQSQNQDSYEKDAIVSTGKRTAMAEQSITERATTEARNRLSRIESRHWSGMSAQRPRLIMGPYAPAGKFLYVPPWNTSAPSVYPYTVWIP